MTNVTTQLDEFKSTLIATIVDSADKYHLPFLHNIIREYGSPYYIEVNGRSVITKRLPNLLERLPIEVLAEFVEKIERETAQIMHTYNHHNKTLVDKVNKCYRNKNELFWEILNLMAVRDTKEIRDIIGVEEEINREFVETRATDILTHVFDDKDLNCIVEFCRV